MMKYKVGDKFFVEMEVGKIEEGNSKPYRMMPYVFGRLDDESLDKLQRPDDITAEEAWEIAKKIYLDHLNGGYADDELKEIFGTYNTYDIFRNHNLKQAKAKIEAWEAERKIKVGDVVFFSLANKDCIVTGSNDNGNTYIIDKDGMYYICGDISYLKKTGQHIDIQSVLEQIGKTE